MDTPQPAESALPLTQFPQYQVGDHVNHWGAHMVVAARAPMHGTAARTHRGRHLYDLATPLNPTRVTASSVPDHMLDAWQEPEATA